MLKTNKQKRNLINEGKKNIYNKIGMPLCVGFCPTFHPKRKSNDTQYTFPVRLLKFHTLTSELLQKCSFKTRLPTFITQHRLDFEAISKTTI